MPPDPQLSASAAKLALKEVASPAKAAAAQRFFKTAEGEYGEGDVFIGVTVPDQRKVARQFREMPLKEVEILLHDEIHESRLVALFILVHQFERGDEAQQGKVVHAYLANLDYVNNWDLVDSSAPKILGPWLENCDRKILFDLAASGDLWRERVAMLTCLHFIKNNDYKDALFIAEALLGHDHDLIHKAVGWMLREIGNRDLPTLERFLKPRYKKMPRTMLRYAIERMDESKRKAYLKGKV